MTIRTGLTEQNERMTAVLTEANCQIILQHFYPETAV